MKRGLNPSDPGPWRDARDREFAMVNLVVCRSAREVGTEPFPYKYKRLIQKV
jgi:hypothetical protein